jgi:hypothetical protein
LSRTLEQAKAVESLTRAVDRAGEGDALAEAATLLEDAMRHAEELPDPSGVIAPASSWPLARRGP